MTTGTRLVISLFVAVLAGYSSALACTCVPPTTDEKVAMSQIIVLGAVVEVSAHYPVPALPNTSAQDLTIAVEELLRFDNPPEQKPSTLKVQGLHLPCGRGMAVAQGERHVWFLRVEKAGSTPTTVLSGCSLMEPPENFDKVRAKLDASMKPVGP